MGKIKKIKYDFSSYEKERVLRSPRYDRKGLLDKKLLAIELSLIASNLQGLK